jgi:hypothetical protein
MAHWRSGLTLKIEGIDRLEVVDQRENHKVHAFHTKGHEEMVAVIAQAGGTLKVYLSEPE